MKVELQIAGLPFPSQDWLVVLERVQLHPSEGWLQPPLQLDPPLNEMRCFNSLEHLEYIVPSQLFQNMIMVTQLRNRPDWVRSSNNWLCADSCSFCIFFTLSVACLSWSCNDHSLRLQEHKGQNMWYESRYMSEPWVSGHCNWGDNISIHFHIYC